QVLVTVERAGGFAGQVSVHLATSDGSAKSGSDYRATSTDVTFPPGDSQPRVIAIPILDDSAFEADESFQVSLSDPSEGASLGAPSTAPVVIHDNDPSGPAGSLQFAAASYSVSEGAGSVSVVITRTGGSSGQVTVTLASSNQTAIAPLDYRAVDLPIVFG